MSGILEKVIEIVADTIHETANNVSRESDIAEICDSLEIVEVAMSLEEHYDIEIPDDEIEKWTTVADIEKTVSTLNA